MALTQSTVEDARQALGNIKGYIDNLETALNCAVGIIMHTEPTDSRAVSDIAVALAAASCGDVSEPVMRIIRDEIEAQKTRPAHVPPEIKVEVESHSYPYMQIAKRYGLPYATVLYAAEWFWLVSTNSPHSSFFATDAQEDALHAITHHPDRQIVRDMEWAIDRFKEYRSGFRDYETGQLVFNDLGNNAAMQEQMDALAKDHDENYFQKLYMQQPHPGIATSGEGKPLEDFKDTRSDQREHPKIDPRQFGDLNDPVYNQGSYGDMGVPGDNHYDPSKRGFQPK